MPISTSDAATELDGLRAELFRRAKEAGFDDAGIARADARPDLPARLSAWLAQERHGDMGWMAATAARRADPLTLWPAAKSVIMLAMTYGPDSDPLELLARRDRAAIQLGHPGGVMQHLRKLSDWHICAPREGRRL